MLNNDVSSVEQDLLNTDYASLIQSNPYKDLNYKQSPWQKALSWLGFRTNYDAYKESMELQSNEYINQVAQKAYDESYETPSAMAARSRQAGINPDLNGIGDVAGAAQMPADQNPPIAPSSDEAALGQFANFVMTAVTTAVGLSGDVSGIVGSILSNDSKRIEQAGSLMNFAFDALGLTAPISESLDEENAAIMRNQHVQMLTDSVGVRLPRRLRKDFERNVKSFISRLPYDAKATETRNARAKNRSELFRLTGSEFYDESDAVMASVNRPLIELADWLQKHQLENQMASTEVEAKEISKQGEYLDAVEGSLEGEAQNAANRLSTQQDTMNKRINSTMENIVKNLSAEANSGNTLASIALLVFNLMRMSNLSIGSKGASFGFK